LPFIYRYYAEYLNAINAWCDDGIGAIPKETNRGLR
jgi:hypothetical protein